MEGPHQASFDAPLPLLCISQRRRRTSAGHSNHSWCPCARVERGRSSAHPTERDRGCSPSCRKRSSHRTTSLCEMRRVGARESRPLGRVTGNPSEEEESLPPSSLRGNVGEIGCRRSRCVTRCKAGRQIAEPFYSSCQPCFGTLTTSSDVRLTPLRSVECINGVRHEHRKRIRLRRGGENKGG